MRPNNERVNNETTQAKWGTSETGDYTADPGPDRFFFFFQVSSFLQRMHIA